MTFMEEAWVSNSKMYLLHGSVEYWILIGLSAVKYYCIIERCPRELFFYLNFFPIISK